MTTDTQSADHTTPESFAGRGWLLSLLFGISLIVLGTAGLYFSVAVTFASVMVFGAFLAAGAVEHVVEAMRRPDHRSGSRLEHAVMALLYLGAALIVLVDPVAASMALTLVLAGLFAGVGVLRLVYAWKRRDQWGESVLHAVAGVAALVLGIAMAWQWPFSSLWVLGFLVSIELLMNGWLLAFAALSLRRLQRESQSAVADGQS